MLLEQKKPGCFYKLQHALWTFSRGMHSCLDGLPVLKAILLFSTPLYLLCMRFWLQTLQRLFLVVNHKYTIWFSKPWFTDENVNLADLHTETIRSIFMMEGYSKRLWQLDPSNTWPFRMHSEYSKITVETKSGKEHFCRERSNKKHWKR